MAMGVAASMLLLPLSATAQAQKPGLRDDKPSLEVQKSKQKASRQVQKANALASGIKPFAGARNVALGRASLPIATPSSLRPQREETARGQYSGMTAVAHRADATPIVPPYEEHFDSESALSSFTIIDNNQDGSSWTYDAGTTEDPNGAAKYSYSEQNTGDDWLITPPIKLEKEKLYTVKFKLKTKSAFYSEKVEVKFGHAATAEAMTQELLPVTPVVWEEWEEITREVIPTESGDYYFGFHAVSDKDQYAFFVDDIEVSAGMALLMPDTVSHFQVTPGDKGAQQTTLSFDMPSKSLNGSPLTGNIGAKVFRNGEMVKELDNLSPGSHQTYLDETPAMGVNTYYIVAFSSDGEGKKSPTVEVFVGPDCPVAPLQTVAQDNIPSVLFSWNDADQGAHGGYVAKSALTHKIYEVKSDGYDTTRSLLAETELGQQSYSLTMRTDEGLQELRDFGVTAVNALGESEMAVAPSIIVGAPYELPFTEQFKNGELDNAMWWTRGNGDSEFIMLTDYSSDGNGCIAYDSYSAEEYAALGSGKLSLAGAQLPKLTFTHWAAPETDAKIVVAIQRPDGTEDVLKTILTTSEDGGWLKDTIDIATGYAALPYLFLQFTVSCEAGEYVMLDEISITDPCDYDMAVKSISLPATTKKGEQAEVGVTVMNRGAKEAAAYTVSLYADGNLVDTKASDTALGAMNEATYTFVYNSRITDSRDAVVLKATVDYDGDMKPENNEKTTTLTLVVSDLAQPESALAIANADGSNTVKWTTPADARKVVREGFEDYDSWTQDCFGGWTARYEGNKDMTGNVFANYPYPGEGEPFAFTLVEPLDGWLDTETLQKYPVLRPHGGDKYLAAFYSLYEDEFIDANDWLISPELSGYEQTVSFWVGNLNAPGATYAESFDVLYSTTGTEPTDFTPLGDTYTAESGQWEEVNVTVPEGAKYFAIHRTTKEDNAMVLLVDDVTYETGAQQVTGYNLYRDDLLIATLPADQLEYTDTETEANREYTYAVTARYGDDESAPTLAIWTPADQLDAAKALLQTTTYTIYTLDGQLVGKDLPSLRGLKRGLYIINDRKVSIK